MGNEILVVLVVLLAIGVIALGAWLGVVLRRVSSGRAETEAVQERERVASARAALVEDQLEGLRASEAEARERVVALSADLAAARERAENAEILKRELERNEQRVKETFAGIGAEALRGTADELIKRAKEQFAAQQHVAEGEFEQRREAVERLVKPIGETLEKTREKLDSMEKVRLESHAAISERMEAVVLAGRGLREETSKLTKALSRPEIRGQYGEIQLRRVAELAGMTSYCDFSEQTSTRNSDGELLRPDMVVRLPNERVIAVDAKTNTYAYLEAVNAETDEQRDAELERFARHVADQAKKLSGKKYWSLFDGAPEFVVMFVPGDHFIDAALAKRPGLLEEAAQQNVILASPSTLIGLLRAVAVGWREHALTEQAGELLQLGQELHERAAVVFEHTSKLGKSLDQSVEHYNKLVGSIDTRVTPTLRKFEEAGAKSAKSLSEVKQLDRAVRAISAGNSEEPENG